jgi:hypothetical protein
MAAMTSAPIRSSSATTAALCRFFAAFGHDTVGTVGTPTTINSGEMEGILMIAVQAVERRTAENADLKTRIEALERVIDNIQSTGRP